MTAAEPAAAHSNQNSLPQAGAATDPVCGMSVDPATARYRSEHAGKTYSFCSARCLERFTAEPRRFLAPAPASAPTAVARAGRWTCPMHPEIVRDGPGACPICGMALEPMTPTAGDEANPELADMTRRFWVAAALSVPLLVLAMGGDFVGFMPMTARVWLQLGLATPAVLWGG